MAHPTGAWKVIDFPCPTDGELMGGDERLDGSVAEREEPAGETIKDASHFLSPSLIAIAALVGVTILTRIPALASTGPLGYDDGVYGASIAAMRHGALPFRDVFSSQGPLFLPLAWLFDLAGFHASWAPRLVAVASGVVLVVAPFVLARHAMEIWGAVAVSTLVALSPLVLGISGPLSADGVALAFATSALAVAAGLDVDSGIRVRWISVGLLVGCALAVKGPIVVGPGVAALWLVMRRRGLHATHPRRLASRSR